MAKQNKSIILLICYFGKLPWYFDYFLHSCKFNPKIHFYLITDNDLTKSQIPLNVFPVQMSLEEMKQIATSRFGFEVALEQPYKFCDFRPALAYLMPKLIEEYDFWGYGDIDVIYGNIRNFITDEMLIDYDVISVRHDFLSGVFSLFRNCKEINELFKKSKDYKKVFTNGKHCCFDETNFTYDLFAEGFSYSEIESEIESMTHLVKKLHYQKVLNAYFDFHIIEGLPGKIKWSNGILTYKNTIEAILYHLIKLKRIYFPEKAFHKIPDTFYISPTRIYHNRYSKKTTIKD